METPCKPKFLHDPRPLATMVNNNNNCFSLKTREPKEDAAAVIVEPPRGEPKKSISMGQIQPTGNQPQAGQIMPTSQDSGSF